MVEGSSMERSMTKHHGFLLESGDIETCRPSKNGALELVNLLISVESEIARIYFTLSRSAEEKGLVKLWGSLVGDEKYHEWILRDARRCLRVFEGPLAFCHHKGLPQLLAHLKSKREDNLRALSSVEALRLTLEIEKLEANLLYRDGVGSLVSELAEDWRPLEAHWRKISEAIHDYAPNPRFLREVRKLLRLESARQRIGQEG
jgi:hypothetical protein